MSGILVGDVLDGAPFKGNTLMVFIALAENADTETGICFPSNQLLAWRTRQTGRNVRNCIRELVDADWLAIVPGAGDRGTNVYRLNIQRLQKEAAARRQELRDLRRQRYQKAVKGLEKAVEEAQENLFEIAPEDDGGRKSFPGGAETAVSGEGGNSSFRRTVSEPSEEPSVNKNSPLPPSQARGVKENFLNPPDPSIAHWSGFKLALKNELYSVSPAASQKFVEEVPGQHDYDSCFRDWWLDMVVSQSRGLVLCTTAADPIATQHGLEKYSARVARLGLQAFGRATEFRVMEPP